MTTKEDTMYLSANKDNTELSAQTLEIAYSAVKAQRMRGEQVRIKLRDPQLAERLATAEATLRIALCAAKSAGEIASRGSAKPRTV
jgi:hypothetical protein